MTSARPVRVVVGVSGATGSPLAKRVLEMLGDAGIERHLVVSPSARRTAAHEIPGVRLIDLAETHYSWRDIGAPIASGSFPFDAMLVVPCSVKTLSAIATGVTDNLLTRAADVARDARRSDHRRSFVVGQRRAAGQPQGLRCPAQSRFRVRCSGAAVHARSHLLRTLPVVGRGSNCVAYGSCRSAAWFQTDDASITDTLVTTRAHPAPEAVFTTTVADTASPCALDKPAYISVR